MERQSDLALVCVGVSLLISCHPVEAWYKQSTGPQLLFGGSCLRFAVRYQEVALRRRSESEETLMDSGETVGNSVLQETNRQSPSSKTWPSA
ncbi:hypothetical protein FQN60_012278 [Etheostoma spectabile]|uniref:Uncharacterized protein n=1 Tax=Etheostoma spectabile TaxID=54343 RepID=A0A5J5DPL6_9PERO|nr:hypothetical protein FQN60_012278 [Etheostoma spectabile]